MTIKNVSVAQKNLTKLIKSYFNFFLVKNSYILSELLLDLRD